MSGLLVQRYDGIFVDLDGVVYRGDEPIQDVGSVLDKVRGTGARLLFLTNNSSRTPEDVAAHLERMGVHADPGEILTSAVATAVMLEREGAQGRTAFVIGERGIRNALQDIGVQVLDGDPDSADMVVIGFDRSADYSKLRTASLLVQRGARLVATNADGSYPAPNGLWPGAGALLSAVVTTTGAAPMIVGKPSRPLFEAAVQLTAARRPLVVGDRLDTDIAGADAMGWDAVLVFTGASMPADLLRSDVLPTYVGQDISVLLDDRPALRFRDATDGDLEPIVRLLERAGLHSDGAEARLASTVVGVEDASIGATAAVEGLDSSGLLRSVVVRPDLQRKGAGALVVASAIRQARERGVEQVALFTESARSFFARLGFREVGRGALPPAVQASAQAAGECPQSAVAMVLDL